MSNKFKSARKLRKEAVLVLLGLAISVFLVGGYVLASSIGASDYYVSDSTIRSSTEKPYSFQVENGDVLQKDGIEIMVFENVKTGWYTVTNEGNFKLYRKN